MKHIASILAAFFSVLLLSSPAAAQCNCASSSLMGTSVNTSAGFLGLNPAHTVTSGVEIPTGASVLFPPGSGTSPRTTVDYGANTIRVTFVRQAQSYGGPIAFAFTNLNPTPPAGCAGTPQVVGMTVQSNKPGVAFVASGATFGPHSASVPYASVAGTTWQPGEFILVTLQFGCPGPTTGGFDPCCPPWNAAQLRANLFYHNSAGGIGAPYTLAFIASSALNAQMNTYAAHLQSLNMGFTGVTIQFELFAAGTGPSAVPTGGPLSTGSATWTGSGSPALLPPGFFPTGAMTAGPSGPWYRIRTTIVLNGGPGSSFLPASCLVTFVDVRLQVV